MSIFEILLLGIGLSMAAFAVAVVAIYLLCTLVDILRSALFKLLHIKPVLLWLDKKLDLYRPSETKGPETTEKV